MGDLYRALVEAAAERAADNDGVVDLVSVAEAAGLGFDAGAFALDVAAHPLVGDECDCGDC
jgi:hypothetical protein